MSRTSANKPERVEKMKKLLSILESRESLVGGGPETTGPNEDMMLLHYQILKKNMSAEQREALLSNTGAGLPTPQQQLAITGDLLSGVLRPDQIETFKRTQLVDLQGMSPTQISAFADMGVGHVMSNVLSPSQFNAFAEQREHTISYNQAQTLYPILRGGEYTTLASRPDVSSQLVQLGSLTDRPMTHFIAQRANTQLTGGALTKMKDIKNLISQIQQTIGEIQTAKLTKDE